MFEALKPTKTVAGVMKAFHTAISDLQAISDHHDAVAARAEADMHQAQLKMQDAFDASQEARTVQAKLTALVQA